MKLVGPIQLFALILLIGSVAFAKPTRQQIYGCETPIEAALFESGLLYSQETKSGSSKDLLELLASESGCVIHINFKPRARIWYELEEGTTGMTINGLMNAEREKFAGFAPYMSGKNLVIVKKELGNISTFAEFKKLKDVYIGVVRTYKHGRDIDQFIDEMKKMSRVKEYADDTALLKAFAMGATSIMFQQGLTYEKMLTDHQLEDAVRVLDIDKGPMTGAVALSKKRFTPEQIKAWQALVIRLRREGKIKKVFRKFFSEKTSRQYLL